VDQQICYAAESVDLKDFRNTLQCFTDRPQFALGDRHHDEGSKRITECCRINAPLERLQHPRDDFLTKLAHAKLDDKPLGPLEIGQIMNSFLIAGHGTSVAALGSLLYEVLSRPDVRARLVEEPDLIPSAVEETLRLHTPFFGLYIRATKDVELGGVMIPKDSYLQQCWAAANRDPKVYDDPAEFKLDRKFGRKNRHLTFGFGIHACPGAPTARMELRVALQELLRLLPDIELVAPESVQYEFCGTETAAIRSLPAKFSSKH